MIDNSTLILGPPGCGKTYTLIEKVREKLEQGVHPSRIGVVSFTTKAIEEFIDRAYQEFGLTKKDFPHFKTLHATGYHAMGLQRTDVMDWTDYRTLGTMLGLTFNGADRTSMDDGIALPSIGGSGAKYLQLIMRAAYREVSLDYEYNYEGDYTLHYSKLVQVRDQIEEYKSMLGKVDFADMIVRYTIMVEPPHLDLLIVDEAQDLTPAQWTMVKAMAKNANEVILAGDDDQAIHRWTSVDVRKFMTASSNVQLLKQSYRLPRSVWALAMRIAKRIPGRFDKEFLPREEEGSVSMVGSFWSLPLDQGSWTIMARTNGFVDEICKWLEDGGFYYSRKGKTPVSEDKREAMLAWHDLTVKGESLSVDRVRRLYEQVPKTGTDAVVQRGATKLLDAADPEAELSYDNLVQYYGLLAPASTHPMDAIRLSEYEKIYIRGVERRGESIYHEPRIKVSTIHAMKGGEDENVAVYLGSTYACMEGSKHPEDEHRVFYVAVTRAKKNLYLIDSNKKYRYVI